VHQTQHAYQAFGLRIRSCLPLPEIIPDDSEGDPDAQIVYGSVPADLPNASFVRARFQAAPGAFLLRIEGVARYLVTDGRRIVVEPDAHAYEEDVRLFLLGSAFAALLHQRHDLVLHGSAIEVGGCCVAFLGASGSGKSTLALAFRERGYPILTDDLSVVRAGGDGRLEIQPGYPQAKLWLDSLASVNISGQDLRRIRRSMEKRALPLNASFFRSALPVGRIYVLRPGDSDEIRIEPVGGSHRFAVLRTHTYRFRYLEGSGSKAEHFQSALQLAQQVHISVVGRPRQPFRLAELADRLEADFASPPVARLELP
jgi:hypothetical protein